MYCTHRPKSSSHLIVLAALLLKSIGSSSVPPPPRPTFFYGNGFVPVSVFRMLSLLWIRSVIWSKLGSCHRLHIGIRRGSSWDPRVPYSLPHSCCGPFSLSLSPVFQGVMCCQVLGLKRWPKCLWTPAPPAVGWIQPCKQTNAIGRGQERVSIRVTLELVLPCDRHLRSSVGSDRRGWQRAFQGWRGDWGRWAAWEGQGPAGGCWCGLAWQRQWGQGMNRLTEPSALTHWTVLVRQSKWWRTEGQHGPCMQGTRHWNHDKFLYFYDFDTTGQILKPTRQWGEMILLNWMDLFFLLCQRLQRLLIPRTLFSLSPYSLY